VVLRLALGKRGPRHLPHMSKKEAFSGKKKEGIYFIEGREKEKKSSGRTSRERKASAPLKPIGDETLKEAERRGIFFLSIKKRGRSINAIFRGEAYFYEVPADQKREDDRRQRR